MPKQSSCTTTLLGRCVVTVSEVQSAGSVSKLVVAGQVVRYYVSFPTVFVGRIVESTLYVFLYVRCVALQLAALT